MSHRACPGSSSLAEDEHLRLQSEASTPYDPTNGAHLSLLRALWVGAGLGPGDEFEPVSTRWLSIGFQGADPSALHPPTPPTPSLQAPASSLQPLHPPASTPKGADPSTDLRGAGLLGLRQLLHFYRAAHLVCHDTEGSNPGLARERAGLRQLALLYSRVPGLALDTGAAPTVPRGERLTQHHTAALPPPAAAAGLRRACGTPLQPARTARD